MNALEQGLALDDLAQHLCDFLPGTPHPYADKDLSFPGVARELGLSPYWRGGSKQPAIRKMLEGVLNSGTGKFSPLKVEGKGTGGLGLFVSYNRFSEAADVEGNPMLLDHRTYTVRLAP